LYFFFQVLLTLGGAIIVAASSFPILMIPVVFVLALFYVIRFIYLKTSKEVKRLDGMSEYNLTGPFQGGL